MSDQSIIIVNGRRKVDNTHDSKVIVVITMEKYVPGVPLRMLGTIGLGFAIVTIILALSLFLKEILTSMNLNHPWVIKILNIAIIPLIVIFIISIFLTFYQ